MFINFNLGILISASPGKVEGIGGIAVRVDDDITGGDGIEVGGDDNPITPPPMPPWLADSMVDGGNPWFITVDDDNPADE